MTARNQKKLTSNNPRILRLFQSEFTSFFPLHGCQKSRENQHPKYLAFFQSTRETGCKISESGTQKQKPNIHLHIHLTRVVLAPLTCIRSALHTRQPNGSRSCPLARHCRHVSQVVRTHTHAHPLSAAHMPAKCRPLTRHRLALHACQPNGQNTRSRAQHCRHASQVV